MTLVVNLPEEVARRLEAAARERGQTVDEVAADVLRSGLVEPTPTRPRRHLAFASVGASNTSRGAADTDKLLAEGFGRD